MNTIVFETSTISDVLTKAAKVAPREGSVAFGKAPGVHISVTDDGYVVVRSTDLELFYTQWTSGTEKSEGSWEWNVTARIAEWCSKLPFASGSFVSFTEENGVLILKHKSSIKKIPLIIGSDYPEWDAFESADCETVLDMAGKINEVNWASALASDGTLTALSGIYFNGTHVIAANNHRIAKTKFDFAQAIKHPVTIPGKKIASIINQAPEVNVTCLKTGIGIEPDDYSQVIIKAFAQNPIEGVRTLSGANDYTHYLPFNTENWTNVLERLVKSSPVSENPIIKILIGNGSVSMNVKGGKDETAYETLEVPGYADHDIEMISFNPDDFLRAISATPNHSAVLWYGSLNPDVPNKMNMINAGDYYAWIARKVDINA